MGPTFLPLMTRKATCQQAEKVKESPGHMEACG